MFARLNCPLDYVQCNPKPYHFTQNLTNKINIVFVYMIFLNIVIHIKFCKFVFRNIEKILATILLPRKLFCVQTFWRIISCSANIFQVVFKAVHSCSWEPGLLPLTHLGLLSPLCSQPNRSTRAQAP
jgi:hypothetical protein